jgi:dienelactone hydrolase
MLVCLVAALAGTRYSAAAASTETTAISSSTAPTVSDWRAAIQTPPTRRTTTTLSPVFVNPQGRPIRTVAEWQARRARILADWQAILGRPPDRCPLAPREIESRDFGTYLRRKILLQVEPDEWMPAWLFVPKGKGPWPAVVEMHPTRDENMDYSLLDGTALYLVEHGYVVLAPRNFLWGYRGLKMKEAATDLLRRYPQWTGMGKMLRDGQRAVDYLETLDFVRRDRIGAIGHSLGAKEALYMAAFDPRIIATVSSEGGIGLTFSNWDAIWYLGDQIHRPDFGHDQHEVLALVAPRAFLLLGGDSADGDRSWSYIEAVLPVWKLLGVADAVGMLNHKGGHKLNEPARRLAYQFLDRFLKR